MAISSLAENLSKDNHLVLPSIFKPRRSVAPLSPLVVRTDKKGARRNNWVEEQT